MNRGRVIGTVWATRMAPGLRGQKLALVDLGADRLVVAADTLDARNGDRVLVSWGSGARNVLTPGPDNRGVLCDAAISQVIDGVTGDDQEA